MADKPSVLVGRKLPPAVEARLAQHYDARLNPAATPFRYSSISALSRTSTCTMQYPAIASSIAAIRRIHDWARFRRI